MKKPDFVDVIEYVRAGEEDPAMEETLRLSPDGQELLKQARFICALLQHQFMPFDKSSSAGFVSDRFVGAAQLMEEPTAPIGDNVELDQVLASRTLFRQKGQRFPSILDQLDYHDPGSEELGTLEFAAKGKMVFASYQPSKAVVMRYDKQPELSWLSQDDDENIVIQGQGVTLTFANRWAVSEPAKILVALGFKRTPARHFKFLFMPDSGPFQQIETDRNGIVKLPAPDQSGTLLIDTHIPQLLHINYKK